MYYQLKEYPPSAKISSLKRYLERYRILERIDIDSIELHKIDQTFLNYLYRLTKRYSIKDLKRFAEQKRYSLMFCFLFETRKILLDHLVKMHDQYMMDMLRHSKRLHEKKHRELRRRQKTAIDTVLDATNTILDWPNDKPLMLSDLWQSVNENSLRSSLNDLKRFTSYLNKLIH